ncbi:hypothetical protein [Aquisphaera insulae]|uniref:hypothetical protein n=1 Tax=Aquisphaera insulae TaxID=2712864 RepID=UPI0013ECB4C9|nr:hypothetical protein [Aquisphaera insulae]
MATPTVVTPARVEPAESMTRRVSTAAMSSDKLDSIVEIRAAPDRSFQQIIQVAIPERQRTNPVGVAAFVLGIIAMMIAWVPFLGLVAVPVALLGGLLGAIGLIYGLVSRRGKVVTSSIGIVLCLGSIVLSVAMTGTVANRVGEAMKEANQKASRSAQPAISLAPVAPDMKAQPIGAASAPALAVQPTAEPAPIVETWLSPDQPGQLGNVQVRLMSVILAPVSLRDRTPFPGRENERGVSKEPLLSIVVEISNLDQNRKLDFKTLAGKQFSFERDSATLKDNFGNRYRGINFGFSSLPELRTEEESIYPGKSVKDHLVFEAPIGTATHLDLEIPALNVGQSGFFRFRIPAQFIQHIQGGGAQE